MRGTHSTAHRRILDLVKDGAENDLTARAISLFLAFLILANSIAVILESVTQIATAYGKFFEWFEVFSVAVFTVEYLLRLWIGPERGSRLRYIFSPLALIDLVAILPFYLGSLIGVDLRILRLLRLLRLLKLSRHFSALSVLWDALRAEARGIASAMLILWILTTIAASLMHLAERAAQPEAFGDIPSAMWWAIVTLTTVGYGDVTPITSVGRIIGVIIMMLGVGMVALPAGMLASRFSEELRKRREQFAKTVRVALVDGVLSDDERDTLEKTRQRLCLSSDDAERLIQGTTARGTCPACGAPTNSTFEHETPASL